MAWLFSVTVVDAGPGETVFKIFLNCIHFGVCIFILDEISSKIWKSHDFQNDGAGLVDIFPKCGICATSRIFKLF